MGTGLAGLFAGLGLCVCVAGYSFTTELSEMAAPALGAAISVVSGTHDDLTTKDAPMTPSRADVSKGASQPTAIAKMEPDEQGKSGSVMSTAGCLLGGVFRAEKRGEKRCAGD